MQITEPGLDPFHFDKLSYSISKLEQLLKFIV